jgi:hypothetical protein
VINTEPMTEFIGKSRAYILSKLGEPSGSSGSLRLGYDVHHLGIFCRLFLDLDTAGNCGGIHLFWLTE